MLRRLSTTLLLRPEDVPASSDQLEVVGAFNPGAIQIGDEIVLLVRIAERPREIRSGWLALPRISAGKLIIDWVREDEYEHIDPRVVRRKADGIVRLTFVSHLVVARSSDDHRVTHIARDRWLPQHTWEEYGIEDPRITRLDDDYFITYVAVSRHGAATALARTRDFQSFERLGIIFPPENKDVVLFPERINHRFVAIHRPNGHTRFTIPEMWLSCSLDLLHWGAHVPLPLEGLAWQSGRVGAGTPPLLVGDAWLAIYHGNQRPTQAGDVGCYTAGAVLLDRHEPWRIRRRSGQPLLAPIEPFERTGFVADVVFPTGVVQRDDRLLIYYGAADRNTAVVELSKEELIASLEILPATQSG